MPLQEREYMRERDERREKPEEQIFLRETALGYKVERQQVEEDDGSWVRDPISWIILVVFVLGMALLYGNG